jgi:hypothetical protein
MLAREVGFHPNEHGNHDYFRTPEIVEDICRVYTSFRGVDLLSKYIEQTRPCIVKFHAPGRAKELGTALYYLHEHFKHSEPLSSCSICFGGEGTGIPPEHILKVEFPEYAIRDGGV